MAPRKFTDEQEQEICRRYLAGEGSTALSSDFNVTPRAILLVLRRIGVKVRPRRLPKNNPSAAQEAEIVVRYQDGATIGHLASALCITSATVSKVLTRNGVDLRISRRLTDQQERQACRRYLEGENTVQLGKAFGVTRSTMQRILARNGVRLRSRSEAKGGLSENQEKEACARYQRGETSTQISNALAVSSGCILSALARNNIEIRKGDCYGDSVQDALDGTRRHANARECEFYLFELARYSDTHCKPGIAFDVGSRLAQGGDEYGEEVLRLLFATRAEAWLLEQAVLDATRGCADCPEDLWDWRGASEIRAMPAEDMAPIVLRLHEELLELGCWEFAARYVPMTAAQRATCQQRALQEVAA